MPSLLSRDWSRSLRGDRQKVHLGLKSELVFGPHTALKNPLKMLMGTSKKQLQEIDEEIFCRYKAAKAERSLSYVSILTTQ